MTVTKKTILALVLTAVSVLLFASCAAREDDSVAYASAQQGPAASDAHKEALQSQSAAPVEGASPLSFRGIAFGATVTEVIFTETLDIVGPYSNALDFEPVEMYTYNMTPTYWFDEASLFFSGSYSIQQSEYATVTQTLQAHLTTDYGQPAQAGYYDFDNSSVSFASEDEAVAAIDSGGAYYYVSYNTSSGLVVELFVQASEAGGYDHYIYYTDPAYMG